MINLLPDKNKNKLKKEKGLYVLLVLSFYFIIFVIFLSTTFYMLNEVSKDNLIKEEEKLRSTEDSFEVIKRVEAKAREVNNILDPLDEYYNKQIKVTEVFKKTLLQTPQNVFVESFAFDLKNNKAEVQVTGFTENYQSLLDMEKNLDNYFFDVSFDTATWLQISDINFSVTFEVR